jgi:NADH-quinone oxidoreductase subunit H
MTNFGYLLLQLLFFPGLAFTAVFGLVSSWIDRKVTARIHMRVGPPFLQPFYDILKLMIKETTVPKNASQGLFLSAPLLGFSAAALAGLIIGRNVFGIGAGFNGDIIVLIYLLTMPAVSVILGSFSSGNPLASLGGSREMKLMMAYELPFVLAIIVPVIHSGSIQLGTIVSDRSVFFSLSGIIALLVAVICMQAKLTLVPFDAPEAETELAAGAYIEYSGPPLGFFKLTRAMMLFIMPLFLITLFCGGIINNYIITDLLLGILKYIAFIVIIILIKNTAPRLRIDQAVKFFLGPVTIVAVLAVILALIGL